MSSNLEGPVQGAPNPNIQTQLPTADHHPDIRQVLARATLSLSLAVGGGAVIGGIETIADPTPQAAYATGDTYPDSGKPCVNLNDPDKGKTTGTGYWCDNYDWGDFVYNAQGQIIGNSTLSPRHYGYRNCTDWVAWRIGEMTGVILPSTLGDAQEWDNNAPSSYQVDNTPNVGDIAVWEIPPGGTYGHVAVVEGVNSDGTVNISEYNRSQNGTYGTRNNVTADHYIDVDPGSSPGPSSGEVTAISSQYTAADGTQHVYWATDDGKLRETWFRPGVVHTNLIYDFSGEVTAMDSQFTSDDQAQHVYIGTDGGEVYEVWWSPGSNGYQMWQAYDANSRINSLDSQRTSDGTTHIYTGTQDGKVRETWFRTGVGPNTWEAATSNSPVFAVTSQITSDGKQHIYWGNGEGRLHDTKFWPGNVQTDLMADFPGAITAVSSQITPNGDQHVYSGTDDGKIRETWAHAGSTTYNTWEAANVSSPVNAVSSQYTSGDNTQHVYSGADDGKVRETWFYPGTVNSWEAANAGNGLDVTVLSSQITPDGTQHIYWGTADGKVYETWFYPGVVNTWQLPS